MTYYDKNTFYFQHADLVLVNLNFPAIPTHLGMKSTTKPTDHNVKSESEVTFTYNTESLYLDFLLIDQYKVSVFLIVRNLIQGTHDHKSIREV